ncbi:MAG: GtrA family protein [Patescibacteria group bacterium]|nr:GtrA family protein [Patescibacteria group bacterium]
MTKKDLYLVSLIGFLFGLLVLLPAKNLGLVVTPKLALISVVGFTVLAPIALLILKFLSRFWAVLYQFGKFAAVGALNTVIDLGVLNFLILLTGVYAGIYFSVFKAISFLAATVNSYFWNKFWTFQSKIPVKLKEFSRFIFFTIIGLLINVSIASFIVTVLGPVFEVDPRLWVNIGALIATVISLLWNFLAYRYIVFKSQAPSTKSQISTNDRNSNDQNVS